MSTTLTNGLKLPDKGSVDWYADMQSNYTILDNSVGTIAEHTTALAGKAPAVHTHTKSDITDFPAYGNTAGTICEGNDSRLSDARTPVAHTHTKSDVTDLLNSNFIPSANNSYDLGSSSYQWNNLYAKNYFYNGTAWGLDKANEWTGDNTFSSATNSVLYFKSGTSGSYSDIRWKDNNGSHYATLRGRVNELTLGLQYSSASAWYSGASITINNNGNVQIKAYDGTESWTVNFTPVGVYPTSDKALALGTSDKKWKTLNGINPGALSIFNPSATQDPIDVPNTWVTDGSAWNTLNVSNMGDGWICLTYRLCGPNDYILVRFGGTNANTYPSMIFPATLLQDSKYYIYALMPVAKAMGNIYLEIKLDSNTVLVKHSFIPAYGTV